jgi:putative flippase GtrA
VFRPHIAYSDVGSRLRRWGAFNAVGLCGFVVQMCAITVLTRHWGWPALAATAVALEAATLQNFFGHSLWTWRDRPVVNRAEEPAAIVRGWLGRYGRYQAAKAGSLGGNLVITALLMQTGLQAEIANTAAVLACAIPNFLVSERVVFS